MSKTARIDTYANARRVAKFKTVVDVRTEIYDHIIDEPKPFTLDLPARTAMFRCEKCGSPHSVLARRQLLTVAGRLEVCKSCCK